ncbi:MAG: hypothetical protein MZW92_42230 [Comamonadaceae bacterium]|nr:hypothetical protein [Comamonadaceae bacterium]
MEQPHRLGDGVGLEPQLHRGGGDLLDERGILLRRCRRSAPTALFDLRDRLALCSRCAVADARRRCCRRAGRVPTTSAIVAPASSAEPVAGLDLARPSRRSAA